MFLAWFCFASYKSLHWKILSKEEEYLPNGHFIIKAKSIITKQFLVQLEGDFTDVDIIFGVKSLNKEEVQWWDPNGIGKPIWDRNFDITDAKTQIAHLKLS